MSEPARRKNIAKKNIEKLTRLVKSNAGEEKCLKQAEVLRDSMLTFLNGQRRIAEDSLLRQDISDKHRKNLEQHLVKIEERKKIWEASELSYIVENVHTIKPL